MRLFLISFIVAFTAIANQKPSQTIICVHPDDEKLGHKIQPESCRATSGHGGVLKSDQSVVDICAECQAQHSANPDQCKPTPLSCSRKRPVAE